MRGLSNFSMCFAKGCLVNAPYETTISDSWRLASNSSDLRFLLEVDSYTNIQTTTAYRKAFPTVIQKAVRQTFTLKMPSATAMTSPTNGAQAIKAV